LSGPSGTGKFRHCGAEGNTIVSFAFPCVPALALGACAGVWVPALALGACAGRAPDAPRVLSPERPLKTASLTAVRPSPRSSTARKGCGLGGGLAAGRGAAGAKGYRRPHPD
jgi:hypothetical protein